MNEVSKIVMLPVESLRPYEKNARKHGEKDVAAIAESIKEFGFNDPIGIWGKDNLIVEGHGRLEAAKSLGMKEVPCIRLDHLTDEQRRAYAIAHNRTAELSDWNAELLNSELVELNELGFNIELTGFDVNLADKETEKEQPAEFDPTVALPDSRILVSSISAFGTNSERFIEIQLSQEEADRLLERIDKLQAAEVGRKLREALNGL